MYKVQTRIRYSECGEDGKAKLTTIVDLFQDASCLHSESIGFGVEYLKKQKRAWFLNAWQIEIARYPKVFEEIEIATWATGFRGVFGPRNFCMKTKDGETLVCANSLWVYMDVEKGIPAKPGEEEKACYGEEPPLAMDYAPRKIALPQTLQTVDTALVRRYHVDTNGHMNNCAYVQLAAEILPERFEASRVRVEYKKSAVYQDQIVLKRAVEKDRIVVELCDTQGAPYAAAEFTGE